MPLIGPSKSKILVIDTISQNILNPIKKIMKFVVKSKKSVLGSYEELLKGGRGFIGWLPPKNLNEPYPLTH